MSVFVYKVGMAAPVKVLILGHSFVRRLHQYLHDINYYSMGLNPSEFSLVWRGVGGLTASRLHQFKDLIKDIQPTVLYIEIGTNDLCDPNIVPDDVALLVFNFITTALADFPYLKHVILGQVILRNLAAHSQRFTRPDFVDSVKLYNALMKGLLKEVRGATLWRHKGLCDNVHPFCHSLKRSLVTAASSL